MAAFLDRDGTINVKAPEGDYIDSPARVELLPGAAEAVRRLNDAAIPVVIVTNQRGIALGRMTEDDLTAVHRRLDELLDGAAGARIDAYEHCPHDTGVCDCRKPGTAMLERAAERLGLGGFERTVMVGDSASDVEAGLRAGATTILLRGPAAGEGREDQGAWHRSVKVPDPADGAGADVVLPSLLDAVGWVLDG